MAFVSKFIELTDKTPMLRGLPTNSVLLIALLATVNIVIWLALALPILITHPRLAAPAALSYTLGLRHALDADHIAAIDLTTRRLIAAGRRPASVGTFFSLGHSTIVIITCIVVAATSSALRNRFDDFKRVGNIIGTAVSAVFLIVLCVLNGWVLYRLIQRLRATLAQDGDQDAVHENAPTTEEGREEAERLAAGQLSMEGAGAKTTILRRLFKAIDQPWKMYPLGIVFGLGFDTSSEIAILGIASIQAVQGTSIWFILIFPILFTGKYRSVHVYKRKLEIFQSYTKTFQLVCAWSTPPTELSCSLYIRQRPSRVITLLSCITLLSSPVSRFWYQLSSA